MRPCCGIPLHVHVRHAVSRVLCGYGHFVGRYPWLFILLPLLVFGGLGAGLLNMEQSLVSDKINMPHDSLSFKDKIRMQGMFPDRTAEHYDALELNEDQIMGSLIFMARNNASVYDDDVVAEIRDVIADVKANVTALVDGVSLKYENLCGKRNNECVVTGERLLSPQFNAMRNMGILSYPKWKIPTTEDMVDLSFALADSDEKMKRVGVVRVTFKLRHDKKTEVYAWEDSFVNYMKKVKMNTSDIVFTASRLISNDLNSIFRGDLLFVWLSLGVIAFCACVVAWGGDVVSTRALLVPMGIVSPALGVIGAMGLLSVCGVKVVSMVWVVPLLVLGVGITDMSLLMAAWSSKLGNEDDDVPQRVGFCLAESGPSITVASLCLFVLFSAAYTASFPSVANLGLYAGVAVLFCYISTMSLGVGCLAVHGHRVTSSRHTLACVTTTSRDELRKEGKPACAAVLCGRSVPLEKYGDQGVFEKVPRLLLVMLTRSIVAKVAVIVVFLAALFSSVFGVMNLKLDEDLETQIRQSSHLHDYLAVDSRYFGFSFPVEFVMDKSVEYRHTTVTLMARLLTQAKRDPGIDDNFVRCWLTDFNQSSFYNQTKEGETFPGRVVKEFLLDTDTFIGDVTLDETGEHILASRCYVFSEKNSDPEQLTNLMLRMRSLADDAGFPVFAYHPVFLSYDQRLAILPTLFQTIGVAVAVLCGGFLAFFPELFSVIVVISNAVTTTLGMLGFMFYVDIPVSSVSMTWVVLNAGFVVYFSAHVSAAYLQSEFATRSERVADAVSRAAAPLFNGAVCLVAGVLVFLAATSYSLDVFFSLTLLTVSLAMFYVVFFTPTILFWIGCQKSQAELDKDGAFKAMMKQRMGRQTKGYGKGSGRAQENGKGFRRTLSGSRQNHGYANGEVSPRYLPSTPSILSVLNNPVIPNGSATHQHLDKEKNREPVWRSASVPLYQNTFGTGHFRHSLSSSNYDYVGPSMVSKEYQRASSRSAASSHYENWSGWKRSSRTADVYDIPAVSPRSSQRDRVSEHTITPHYINANYIDLRPLEPMGSPPRNRSPEPASPSAEDEDGWEPPQSPKERKVRGDPETDIVASLKNLKEIYLDLRREDEVASLEKIHNVACTLSTSGVLGSTQTYVTENFRDIDC